MPSHRSHQSQAVESTVLMVGPHLASKGGISSVARMYAQGGLFKQMSYLSAYADGDFSHKVMYYLGFLMRYCWALLTRPSVRIVHIHTASYGSFLRKSSVILLAKLTGRKVVLHVHGAEFNLFYYKMPMPIRFLIRSLLRSCDVMIALSQQWRQDLYTISGNTNIRVIYNPTVLRQPVRDRQPEALGSDSAAGQRTVNFLFMGRLGKRKGVYDIIRAAGLLKAENITVNLYGDGEIERVRREVQAQGQVDTVQVCGWIDGSQKEAVFQQADVLLLPSYHEGLPIAILEAMAYGLPVLATDVGGVSEAVEDGVNGCLLQPGDCQALAEAMDRLAASGSLRARMGYAGYEIAARQFALPVIIEQLESLYDQLAERHTVSSFSEAESPI